MAIKPSQYKILQPFEAWVQQSLPAIYDDSLSYTDLLSKMLSYLNVMIENNNTVVEEIKKLSDFVNAKISDEHLNYLIEEKLNELVLSGALDEMLNKIINPLPTPNRSLTFLEKSVLYGIGMSYYEYAWTTRNPGVSYGNSNTPLDNNTPYNQLDCSSFIILCLLGIDYANSPFCSKSVEANGKLGFSRNFYETVNNKTGLLRYAYEIALYGRDNNLLFKPTKPSDYQTGDIVFWRWNDEKIEELKPDDWAYETYGHIAHVGMIVEGCTKFSNGLGLLHCVNTSALMQLTSFEDYNPATLTLYPYVLRPKINVSNYYVNGYWRFRALRGYDNLLFNHYGYTYSGGLIPSNMYPYFVDKKKGTVSTDNSRFTTGYLPYSIAMFVTNSVSNIGFHVCYYDGIKDTENNLPGHFLGYSENKTEVRTDARLCRIEFYKASGDMTDLEKNQIQTKNKITYHTWCDVERSFISEHTDDLYICDTIKYFTQPTKVEILFIESGPIKLVPQQIINDAMLFPRFMKENNELQYQMDTTPLVEITEVLVIDDVLYIKGVDRNMAEQTINLGQLPRGSGFYTTSTTITGTTVGLSTITPTGVGKGDFVMDNTGGVHEVTNVSGTTVTVGTKLTSLKGPTGAKGESGQDGATGPQGKTGGYYVPSKDSSGNLVFTYTEE